MYKINSIDAAFTGKRCIIEKHNVTRQDNPVSENMTFEVCKVKDAVGVIPVDDNGQVLVLENFRYPVGKRLIEIVAGLIEPEEDIADAAIRECEEETGYIPSSLQSYGSFYTSPGLSTEKIHLFQAMRLQPGKQQLEQMEDLRVVRYTPMQLLKLLHDGHVEDMKTALAISYLTQMKLR